MSANHPAIARAVRTASTASEVLPRVANQLGVDGSINTKLVFVDYDGAWESS